MPTERLDNESPEGHARYTVISRDPVLLVLVAKTIRDNPLTILLDELGPSDQPHTLVVSMTEQEAANLKQLFGDRLVIERDKPLTLFVRIDRYPDPVERESTTGSSSSLQDEKKANEEAGTMPQDPVPSVNRPETPARQPRPESPSTPPSTAVPPSGSTPTPPPGPTSPQGKVLGGGRRRYVIAPRRLGGIGGLQNIGLQTL